jgi:hypothetical protein
MGGNPAAAPVAFGPPLLLFVLAYRFAPERRWVRKLAVGFQVLVLLNLGVNALLGLAPAIDFSVNPVVLLTNVLLPVSVIYLAGRSSDAAEVASSIEEPVALRSAA